MFQTHTISQHQKNLSHPHTFPSLVFSTLLFQSPIPNPQSLIPNPQFPITFPQSGMVEIGAAAFAPSTAGKPSVQQNTLHVGRVANSTTRWRGLSDEVVNQCVVRAMHEHALSRSIKTSRRAHLDAVNALQQSRAASQPFSCLSIFARVVTYVSRPWEFCPVEPSAPTLARASMDGHELEHILELSQHESGCSAAHIIRPETLPHSQVHNKQCTSLTRVEPPTKVVPPMSNPVPGPASTPVSISFSTRQTPQCCICRDEKNGCPTVVVVPCLHLCMCTPCAEKFDRLGGLTCPMCRVRIDRLLYTFA
jgi:hypothetical protein